MHQSYFQLGWLFLTNKNVKEQVILTEHDQSELNTIQQRLPSEKQNLSTFPLSGVKQDGSKQNGNRKCILWPQSIKYT